MALDGRPVWVSSATLPLHLPIRIHLWGNTAGTRMLVGPLEAWEGVRGDVDWRLVARDPRTISIHPATP
jgi:hypothetical protein